MRPRRARAGAADRVDHREILRQQVVADDARHVGAVRLGELPGGVLELLRAHVAGRRVDEIAAKPDSVDERNRPGVIGAAREAFELRRHRRRCRLVAAVAVGAEPPRDGGKLGLRDGALQCIRAGRESRRELRKGGEQCRWTARLAALAVADAERDAGDGTVRAGQQGLLLDGSVRTSAPPAPSALSGAQSRNLSERSALFDQPNWNGFARAAVGICARDARSIDDRLLLAHDRCSPCVALRRTGRWITLPRCGNIPSKASDQLQEASS